MDTIKITVERRTLLYGMLAMEMVIDRSQYHGNKNVVVFATELLIKQLDEEEERLREIKPTLP